MVEKAKERILITGSEGMLGGALFQELDSHYEVFGTTQKDLDVTNAEKVKQVVAGNNPGIIIHTAALTDVDGCEDSRELAYNVNALGTKNIAQASKLTDSILIYLSTDYIFDGKKDTPYKEEDIPYPLSVYGSTKLEGERSILRELSKFVIIRSSWLFGKGKIGFVERIIQQAKAKKAISVVADKTGSPTYVNDLARAIAIVIGLIKEEKFIPDRNILHITNSGFCTWIEYAKKIVELAKIEGVKIIPITPDEFNFKARRPRFSVLDNSRYIKLTGKALRPWQDALKEYLECLKN